MIAGAVVLLVIATKSQLNAQTYWDDAGGAPTTITTHTSGNCTVDGILTTGATTIDATSPLWRYVQGNTTGGVIGMYANKFSNDGAGVEAYGMNAGGQVHAISWGSKGDGVVFLNFDPVTNIYHPNAVIAQNGQTIIGRDLTAANILPTDILTVKYSLGFWSDDPKGYRQIHGNTTDGIMGMYANSSQTDGPNVEVCGVNQSDFPGQIHYNSFGRNNLYGHVFQNYDGVSWIMRMVIRNDGKVVIGNDLMADPATKQIGDYNLYVSKGILTEKLRVANASDVSNWADYVFNEQYQLPTLAQVDAFIKKHKHLPEIPTTEEVRKDGVDILAMDAKLLQKIEELTLYVIQQQKEIEELKSKVHTK